MKLWLVILATVTVSLGSCKKQTEVLTVSGPEYFGYQPGQIRYYRCDSTLFNSFNVQNPVVKRQFIIKEHVAGKFTDLAGNEALRLEQSISFNNDTTYSFFGIVTIQISNLDVEFVQDNRRFLSLSFPVKALKSWDGNLFNDLDRQRFIYTSVNEPFSNGFINFENTTSVNKKDEITIISEKTQNYVYGKGYGLVEKDISNIDIDGAKKDGFKIVWKLESLVP